ncbi:GTP 3',8-cyclase MoaA [Mucilaginibacter sp. UR6-1]|uniref:GTP 3',8-cyclase MoaA n=1 Tax=Mucilaginibacter sp. UR6-1 TaxID=1435643 RepID=UPI0021058268|nr:GTP 3',8-cyclase MoaA [Mucilaginibacter sp. UR6-1]MCC8410087.1 GTP 3',8-cyclase MoaA [Mucilaginibacter sp. UR6-1]
MLTDNHGRPINYLRLAVTDRCNLRCFYCMPEHGLDWLSRVELLSYEELLRISSLMVGMGVNKIRITGGEPFVRRDIMQLLSSLSALPGLDELTITTNGVLTAPYVSELKRLGIRSVNLSLDTLDAARFFAITRRDEFAAVMHTLEQLLKHDIDVKINAVVMQGRNTQDILPLVELTRELPVSVRFIEEMPFNGDGHQFSGIAWDHVRIMEEIRQHHPQIIKAVDGPYSTSYNYNIPGHKGNVGVIAAYSRTFCGTCNRIRVTPTGILKTCLYDDGVLNLRDMLRTGNNDEEVKRALLYALKHRAADGHEAERLVKSTASIHQSMAVIGG